MKPSFLLVAVVAVCAAPAGARLGNAAYLVATSCNGCHSGGTRPELVVTQTTPGPLVPGGEVTFHIAMTSLNGAGAGRKATFSASVLNTAGTFVDGDETDVCEVTGGCPNNTRTAIRDITGRAYDGDGLYEWDITLANLAPGNFNLAVGVNDINDNGLAGGDRNAGIAVPFVVAEGEGEGGEGEVDGEGEGEGEGAGAAEGEGEEPPAEGGCCGGSASQASLGLAGLALLRRRRRRC